MRRRWRAWMVGAGTLAIVVGSSCGPDGSDVYTAPAPSASDADEPDTGDSGLPVVSVEPTGEVVDVRALDNSFIAEEIEVTAGTEVRWENRGRNDHDVVPVDDTQDWGVALADFTPGDSYSHVFTTTGTYRYYCTIHGTADFGMIGVVVVN